MTKDECEKIWEVIFARHVALVKMGVESHQGLDLKVVHEGTCDCISTVMLHYGYDINQTDVFHGILPSSLNSYWKLRLLNFEKKAVAATA